MKATILIPAYNEANVIARTLHDLTRNMNTDDFQIIVIANACVDDTAQLAQIAYPHALVIETAKGGKTNAMNLGFAKAQSSVIVCLDADLSVSAAHVDALIAPILAGQAQGCCGRMHLDLTRCSQAVRAFYRIWQMNPYFDKGKFGGLWALGPDATARIFPLPKVIADDEYVSRNLGSSESVYVPSCTFNVRAPRTIASLIKIRRRIRRGTRQLESMELLTTTRTGSASIRQIASQVSTRPALWPAFVLYVSISLYVRLLVSIEPPQAVDFWERDTSSRLKSPTEP
jgi:glycosyltransferase involved in cell wall biosynthesis